jgi:hypothetical protein
MRRLSCIGLFFLMCVTASGMPFAWLEIPEITEQVISVHSDHVSGTVFFAVTESGRILRSQDSGDTWDSLDSFQHGVVRELQIDLSQNYAWYAIVYSDGQYELWFSPDNGDSWQLRYTSEVSILSVSPSSLASGILLGVFEYPDQEQPVLKKSENAGFDWFDVLVANHPGTRPIWHIASVWQAHWGRYVSYDFGDTWQEQSQKKVAACGYDIPPSLIAPTSEGLFRSRDNLLTWWPLFIKPVNFVEINPRNSNQMFTGLKNTSNDLSLYFSRNGGRTFSEWSRGLPANISDICLAADWLFLAISDGNLYKYDKRLADINETNRVDGADLIVMATAFGSQTGDSRFIQRADLNNDGVIDGSDLSILSSVFGHRFYYDDDDDPGDFPE